MARAAFEVANEVAALDDETRHIYTHDAAAYQELLRAAPWRSDARFFTRVLISVVALMKMALHARAGGDIEVMGLMQGKVDCETRTFYVLDAFALPVEGTETRVNAQNEAYEYMVSYLEDARTVQRRDNVIGWYHSHPGYGPWLSGIDVQTQRTNQQQDPFVAVVIDPLRTMTAGRVDIGAFRTFPAAHDAEAATRPSAVPAAKAADYGAHANQYYALDVELFKSAADAPLYERLWDVYWAQALSTGPSRLQHTLALEQTRDLVARLGEASTAIAGAAQLPGGASFTQAARALPRPADASVHELAQQLERRAADQPLERAAADGAALAALTRHALLQQTLRDALFARNEPCWADV